MLTHQDSVIGFLDVFGDLGMGHFLALDGDLRKSLCRFEADQVRTIKEQLTQGNIRITTVLGLKLQGKGSWWCIGVEKAPVRNDHLLDDEIVSDAV